jgi:hypothetical protein
MYPSEYVCDKDIIKCSGLKVYKARGSVCGHLAIGCVDIFWRTDALIYLGNVPIMVGDTVGVNFHVVKYVEFHFVAEG